jgi:hypothetical protein
MNNGYGINVSQNVAPSSFLLVHGEDATDIFMILNLLTQDGVL